MLGCSLAVVVDIEARWEFNGLKVERKFLQEEEMVKRKKSMKFRVRRCCCFGLKSPDPNIGHLLIRKVKHHSHVHHGRTTTAKAARSSSSSGGSEKKIHRGANTRRVYSYYIAGPATFLGSTSALPNSNSATTRRRS
jgi:hypothetical protein